MPIPEKIDLTDLSIQGENIVQKDLKSLIESEPIVILHFLRHLNCTFCHESVVKLRNFLEKNTAFPPIIFVHQGDIQRGHDFFERVFPGAKHIADEERKIFSRFGILHMKMSAFFSPSFWAQIFRQKLQGYGSSIHPKDDLLLLSGTFLFYNGHLRWVHRAQTASDDPSWSQLNLTHKK